MLSSDFMGGQPLGENLVTVSVKCHHHGGCIYRERVLTAGSPSFGVHTTHSELVELLKKCLRSTSLC